MNPEDLKRMMLARATNAAHAMWGAKFWVDLPEQEREKRLKKIMDILGEFS